MPQINHLHLNAEKIRPHLPKELFLMPVEVFDTIDSTNSEARRRLSQGLKPPFLMIALSQTQGRGRLGRSFFSPHGSGLYMTLVLDSQDQLDRLTVVTPTAAVAVAEAIADVCHKEANIKWVNDLYLNHKKICGILTETVAFSGGYHVMIGIGINLTTAHFPEGFRNPAGAVFSENESPADSSLLCARIVTKLIHYLTPEASKACLPAYRTRLCMVGERVICTHHFPGDGETAEEDGIEGIMLGVDDDYGLILQRNDGHIDILRGGEVSVKRV